jgi:phosphonate transport system substrate-binding protein
MQLKTILTAATICLLLMTASFAFAGGLDDGSKANPLRVMLIPTDAGSSDIIDDYKPVFDAITKFYGIHFKVMAGSSYAAVIEGMCNDQAEVAWYGPVSFGEAHNLCGTELLAVDVKKGQSV